MYAADERPARGKRLPAAARHRQAHNPYRPRQPNGNTKHRILPAYPYDLGHPTKSLVRIPRDPHNGVGNQHDSELCATFSAMVSHLGRGCWLGLVTLILVGCSTSGFHKTGPVGSLDGTLPPNNEPFVPRGAIYHSPLQGEFLAFETIRITDYDWACQNDDAGRIVSGSRSLLIELGGVSYVADGTVENVPIGTYAVRGDSPWEPFTARLEYYPLDAQCQRASYEESGGTVTVEAYVPGQSIQASFDVYFGGDQHLAGHFVASPCSSFAMWSVLWDMGGSCGPAVQCKTGSPGSDAGNVGVTQCQ